MKVTLRIDPLNSLKSLGFFKRGFLNISGKNDGTNFAYLCFLFIPVSEFLTTQGNPFRKVVWRWVFFSNRNEEGPLGKTPGNRKGLMSS